MNFLKKPHEEVILVGGDELQSTKDRRPVEQYAFFASMLVCLVTVLLGWLLMGSAHKSLVMTMKKAFELEQEQTALQQNVRALQSLIAQEEEIRDQQSLVQEALPFDPQYQQMVAFIEDRVDAVSESHQLVAPDHISWRRVLASDVSNEDLQELGIYQYAFSLEGDYDGVLAFLQEMRQSRRLFDLRSLNNFQMDPEGRVSADLSFWAYHIL